MKHVNIAEHGQYAGCKGARLCVRVAEGNTVEVPLSRIQTISIHKQGVSISAALIQACSARGIKLFVIDARGHNIACLAGVGHHAVCAVRQHQFLFTGSDGAIDVARAFIAGKLKNQRAVLRYFGKYLARRAPDTGRALDLAAGALSDGADKALRTKLPGGEQWRYRLLGIEGQGARTYWRVLSESGLLPEEFSGRQGKGASDVTNQALNYGYAILSSMIWHCVINAGLEPYAGLLHTERPGKPSLVLDLMEEYRAWAVDRCIIKLRQELAGRSQLTEKLRRRIASEVTGTFGRRYPYRNRRLSLESIVQRQVYRLAGTFAEGHRYRPYLFRW